MLHFPKPLIALCNIIDFLFANCPYMKLAVHCLPSPTKKKNQLKPSYAGSVVFWLQT